MVKIARPRVYSYLDPNKNKAAQVIRRAILQAREDGKFDRNKINNKANDIRQVKKASRNFLNDLGKIVGTGTFGVICCMRPVGEFPNHVLKIMKKGEDIKDVEVILPELTAKAYYLRAEGVILSEDEKNIEGIIYPKALMDMFEFFKKVPQEKRKEAFLTYVHFHIRAVLSAAKPPRYHEDGTKKQEGDLSRAFFHNDIKSANTLIMPDGRMRITDFSISIPHKQHSLYGMQTRYTDISIDNRYGLTSLYETMLNRIDDNSEHLFHDKIHPIATHITDSQVFDIKLPPQLLSDFTVISNNEMELYKMRQDIEKQIYDKSMTNDILDQFHIKAQNIHLQNITLLEKLSDRDHEVWQDKDGQTLLLRPEEMKALADEIIKDSEKDKKPAAKRRKL